MPQMHDFAPTNFYPYFMEIANFISIWLHFGYCSGSKLLKNFSKSNFLPVWIFQNKLQNLIFSQPVPFLGALWSLTIWKAYLNQKWDTASPKMWNVIFALFFGLFYDFIHNFIVRFMYEDDEGPTWFFHIYIYIYMECF